MTTLAIPAEQTEQSPTRREKRDVSVCSRIGLGALLVVTAALYLWNLSAQRVG